MINLYTLMTENVNGATFINVDFTTDQKLAGGKKNPLQGRVQKRTTGANVMVFQNKNGSAYENMVKRRLEKEGKSKFNFNLAPRTWGSRIPNTCFIEHTNKNGVEKFYLEVIFLKPGTTEYLVDGVITHPSEIQGLKLSAPASAQGGLEDKVIIRTITVDNIDRITVAKQTVPADQLYFDKI